MLKWNRSGLEDEEDPIEGSLEIEASPQGKELKQVEAISSSEKALTALAFVFVVQQCKPAPFYDFDEIDAYLDDEDAARVADLIERESNNTQFIVITLWDVMMAAADLLCGVSMKEQVSKIVSVELEKIVEYKEPQEAVVTGQSEAPKSDNKSFITGLLVQDVRLSRLYIWSWS